MTRVGKKACDVELNPSKCQVLHISRSRRPIKMRGQVLDSIDHARYLGVDISSDLNVSHHINCNTANATKSLGLFVLCLLCLCARLFICAWWSPAGKGLTSWLSFVVSNCEFVTFLFVSWVGCGT